MDKHLEHIKIVEVAYRLPGPLTSLYLQDLGANITRFEDPNFPDPFKESPENPIFRSWYKNLNKNKTISLLEKNKLETALRDCDLLILSLPKKQKEKWGLDHLALKRFNNLCVIELSAKVPAHDLNIISQTKVFKFFLDQNDEKQKNTMPFLPFAGIALASQASLRALGLLIKKSHQKQKSLMIEEVDIKDSASQTFDPLWHESPASSKRFLHTGLYPCYQIYKTQNGHIVLACVEEKFWKIFCDAYNFSFTLEDRFDQTNKIKGQLEEYFQSKTNQQLQEQLGSSKACVNFI